MIFCDLETYSETPIQCGTHKYAEKAEILLFAYAFDSETPKVWDLTENAQMPDDLADALNDPNMLTVWHNGGNFDTVILKHALGIDLPLNRIHDTMVQALMHSLPGALGLLCEIYNLDTDIAKDKKGKSLIQLFCKPRPKNSKIRRATKHTHPTEWQEFIQYATSDILAMRELFTKIPKWNLTPQEVSLWHLDQTINRRGFAVDMDLVNGAIRVIGEEQKWLAKRTQEITEDEVQAATQRDVMLKHILNAYGVTLPDLQASTLKRQVDDPNLPKELRELLEIRLQASSTSTSKYKALLKSVSQDNRLRGTLQFYGASRTGRWAGRIFQPQNISRGMVHGQELEDAINAIKGGYEDLLYG